jgi:hypothetical protein
MIIEASENTDTTTSTITVTDITELVKAAETLSRPIIHIKKEGQESLCVIEGNTKYQYTIKNEN